MKRVAALSKRFDVVYPGGQKVRKSHQCREFDPDAVGSDVKCAVSWIMDRLQFAELTDELQPLEFREMPGLRCHESGGASVAGASRDLPVANASFAVVHLGLKDHASDVRISVVEVGDHLALAPAISFRPVSVWKRVSSWEKSHRVSKPVRSTHVLVFDVENS